MKRDAKGIAADQRRRQEDLASRRASSCLSVELLVRKRRFALHENRGDIAARRICNATRVRSYVTLSGTRACDL